ncbi:MAG: hypothetical protein ACFE8V_16470 [Promethearchaeota archaeon]
MIQRCDGQVTPIARHDTHALRTARECAPDWRTLARSQVWLPQP